MLDFAALAGCRGDLVFDVHEERRLGFQVDLCCVEHTLEDYAVGGSTWLVAIILN